MDFGDILKKWENGNRSSRRNELETWLENNEIFDKDADIYDKKKIIENRRRLIKSKPDDVLDIHGVTSEKAWILLDSFFLNAKDRGSKKLRIIHGKGNHSPGNSVLRSTVQKFIEKCPFAGESGYEKAPNGGSGATWVLLKGC